MNERIKQLAEEAAEYAVVTPSDTNLESETEDAKVSIPSNFIEMFTQLIIQDIDKIVDDLYHVMPLEQAAVLLTLDENIKEHFYANEE